MSREQYLALLKLLNQYWNDIELPNEVVKEFYATISQRAWKARDQGDFASAISIWKSAIPFAEFHTNMILNLIDIQDSLIVRRSGSKTDVEKEKYSNLIDEIDAHFGDSGDDFRKQLKRPRPK